MDIQGIDVDVVLCWELITAVMSASKVVKYIVWLNICSPTVYICISHTIFVQAKKYVVKCILNQISFGGREEFLVKWEGNHKPIWEPGKTLEVGCPSILMEFLNISVC